MKNVSLPEDSSVFILVDLVNSRYDVYHILVYKLTSVVGVPDGSKFTYLFIYGWELSPHRFSMTSVCTCYVL